MVDDREEQETRRQDRKREDEIAAAHATGGDTIEPGMRRRLPAHDPDPICGCYRCATYRAET